MSGLKRWFIGRRGGAAKGATTDPSSETGSRAQALIEEGNRLEDAGRVEAALEKYRAAVEIGPQLARAHVNFGNALQLLGRVDEAIAAQRAALRLDPDNVPAHYNLGSLLSRFGDDAGAERELREALRFRPAMTDARIVLSDVLERRGLFGDAEAELRRAIEHDPAHAMAAHNLALLLLKRGRPDDAETTIRISRSRVSTPAVLDMDLASLYVATGRAREAEPLYRRAMTEENSALRAASGLLFSLNCRDDVDAETVFREHERLGALFDAYGREGIGFSNRPDPNRRLKIGYVSGDFRRHPIGLFMRPVLAQHDREHVDVHCYVNHKVDDDVTQSLKQLAPHWHSVAYLDDRRAVELIRQDQIDVLVDLSGYTTDSRLGVFARRAAPVQVTWLGYLNTTGLKAMDYRLCDALTEPAPEADRLHTETLYRLPHGQWCYEPVYEVPLVDPPHPSTPDALVFGAFNQFAKISDECVALWASVLNRLPHSSISVFGVPEGGTRSRFIERMAKCGVDAARVYLHGRVGVLEYFAAIGNVDVALDAFPYNGATTTLDTLWMGVPLVALRGERGISRGSYSILATLGAPELVALSVEEYVEKNVALATDAAWRRRLRASLRPRLESSPLMDAASFVRDLEAAYRSMWRTYCGKPRLG